MFWKCKICVEKDKQISDLKDQIQFLRKLSVPSITQDMQNLEMNKILDGAALPVIDMQQESPEDIAADREATRILTGNYYEQ